MKRLITLIFTTMLAGQAWAYTFQNANLYYNYSGTSGAVVTSQIAGDYYGNYSGLATANIPSTVVSNGETYSVIGIDKDAFRLCNSLNTVSIPSSVTNIGSRAFCDCKKLKTIAIPGSVTSIGASAFYGTGLTKAVFESIESLCGIEFGDVYANPLSIAKHLYIGGDNGDEITELEIPSSITNVGAYAFSGSNFTSITTNSNADFRNSGLCFTKDGILYQVLDKNTVEVASVTYSGDVIIPATVSAGNTFTVTSIANTAFNNCNLTSLTINADCDISNLSFYFIKDGIRYRLMDNNSVEVVANSYSGSITIPSTVDFSDNTYVVANISSDAFVGCTNLDYTLYDGCKYIGTEDNPYMLLLGLQDQNANAAYIHDDCKCISDKAFYNCRLETVEIPSSVTVVGKYAFYYNSLTTIDIPDGVTNIGDYAFRYCGNLASVTIPESVTKIGVGAFADCTKLSSVNIINGITKIENSAFANCSGLTSITIPETVTSIGSNAFYCPSLTNVEFASLESLFSIDLQNNVFVTNEHLTLHLNINGVEVTDITIPDTITSIRDYFLCGFNNITSVTIPNSVTSIGNYAFNNCSKLSSITIPNSVTSIGDHAFYNCGLKAVEIPNSITEIGDYVFDNCSKLSSITIPNSVTSIGDHAFFNCGLESVEIPNSVTDIGASAFNKCSSLSLVVIPNSVTTMGRYAFSYFILNSSYNNRSKKISFYCEASSKPDGWNYEWRKNDDMETVYWGVKPKFSNDFVYNVLNDSNPYEIELYKFVGNNIAVIPSSEVFNGIEYQVVGYGTDVFKNYSQPIVCRSTTPMALTEDPFPNNNTIYVPGASVDAYKASAIWKRKEVLAFYEVKATSADTTKGTIQGDSLLLENETLTFNANPVEGYHFVKWSDGNTDNPRIYSAACDTSFTAIFEAHTAVTDAAVAATCTATGLTEGSHCSVCGEVFVAQQVTPMLEHTTVVDAAVPATCTETGLTEGSHCSVCNTVLVAQETVAAKGHTEVVDAGFAPTCTEFGITNGKHCLVCNIVLVAQDTIPALGHTVVVDSAVAATATEIGLTEGSHCSVCGLVIVAQDTIPALGEPGEQTAIADDAANAVNIYAHGNTIVIENATEEIRVYNAMGKLVGRDVARNVCTIRINNSGLYIVKTGNVVKRVMVN